MPQRPKNDIRYDEPQAVRFGVPIRRAVRGEFGVSVMTDNSHRQRELSAHYLGAPNS